MRIGWVLIAPVGCRIVDVGCPTTTDIPHPTSRIRPRPRKFREPGFTLVELLVVVAIIALLIAILLPALNKARGAARTVVCSSNLRSVGLGITQYTMDFNQYIPYAAWLLPDNSVISWDSAIANYLSHPLAFDDMNKSSANKPFPVMVCPGDIVRTPGGYWRRSYAMNQGADYFNNPSYLVGIARKIKGPAAGPVVDNFAATDPFLATLSPLFKMSNIPNPSQTMSITENSSNANGIAGPWAVTIYNPAQQLTTDPTWWGVGAVGTINLHIAVVNYVFLDSHVSAMDPSQTIGSGDVGAARYPDPGWPAGPRGIWARMDPMPPYY